MLQQRVLVTPIENDSTVVGHLFIPETVAKNIARGIISAIGEGKLRVGDEIVFDSRQTMPFTFEGKEYLILHESQIIAVLNKKRFKKNKDTQ